jgi:hypothetical protein
LEDRIVNDAFVRRFLPGRAAIGTRVHGWGRWFSIVGVAHDTKVNRLSEPARPYFYVPQAQVYRPEYGYTVFARTAGDVEQAAASLRRAVASADPSVPVYHVMPLAEYIGGPLVVQRAAVRLLGILAAIAVLLAAIGLYGVVSYSVTQRTRDRIRLAMGAAAGCPADHRRPGGSVDGGRPERRTRNRGGTCPHRVVDVVRGEPRGRAGVRGSDGRHGGNRRGSGRDACVAGVARGSGDHPA